MSRQCNLCRKTASDPVTITNGAVTLTVCRTEVPANLVPAGTRHVSVTGGAR